MKIDLAEKDLIQRKQALDPEKSFIVQAPAGSGKTTLLIQRFLTLLAVVKKPEEVLAITFTKKAANEMRVRIINALKQAAYDNKPESSHAQQTWFLAKKVLERDAQFNWNIVNNPNQLRIQTIDSLCSYLTKQLPLLSHFGSQPLIAENPIILYQEAVQEVLKHVEEDLSWSNAIAKLLLHLDNDLNKLHDLLVNLLAKRDQWLSYIHLDMNANEIRKQLENNIALVITDNLKPLQTLFPKELIPELNSIACFAANNLLLNQINSDITACSNLSLLPETSLRGYPAWKGIASLLLTDEGMWRKQINNSVGFPAPSSTKNNEEKRLFLEYKQRATALLTKLNAYDKLRTVLANVFELPPPHYDESQWEILQALLQILKITAAQLRLVFQQHGQIDFIENTQAAILALGHNELPTDLALALDYQIKHILIDEFQDTSFTQYQLLEKLTTGWEKDDGRSLFIVGDPMQSIYRFREAEVGLFLRMRTQGIGNIKLIPLTLATNFRSSHEIVSWNNFHFQSIFPNSNDIVTGAVSYTPSISNQQDTPNSIIKIQGFSGAASQEDFIVEIMNNQNSSGKTAILVRARQHLKKIIPALKKAKIPYQAIEIDPLAEKQTIQDLLSLTSALLHPADRIAWLSILRAPWCGLSLADLLVIAGQNAYSSIYEQLENEEILKKLSEEGKARLARIYPILKTKILSRDRCDLRFWIENTWIALGGPACLQNKDEIADANAFFKLLGECSQEGLNLKKLKLKIDKLFAVPQHDNSILQVMTIHSAKGLEFDTVILPHLERKKNVDDNSLFLWMDYPIKNDQIALLLAPIHATGFNKDTFYNFIYRQQQIKADFEIDRLFYVATTRAKQNLYLLFDTQKKDNGNYTVESGSFLKKLWPFLEKQADTFIMNSNRLTSDFSTEKNIKKTYRLHSDWKNPYIYPVLTESIFHSKPGGFQLIDPKLKLMGTVIHRIFQLIAENGIEWWTHSKVQSKYLQYLLKQAGTSPEHLESTINLILRQIQNMLSDQRGLWIVHPHQDAKSELTISVTIDGIVENLVIDRTFIDHTGTRWIIDYKTTSFENENLDKFLLEEQEKYAKKMHQYANAMRLIDGDRPIRLGLYFPAIPAWKEWAT